MTSTRGSLASLVLVVLAATMLAYAFFATAGFTERKLPDKTYYDRLAGGFLAGHLHIVEEPSKALLAEPNPYDFRTSRHHWRLWDASLHQGKYYFYWGPVPALMAAGAKLVGGRDVVVGDRALVELFVVARLFAGAAILFFVRRWLFPALAPWHIAPALLVWGLVNPYPYVLGRPAVYEAAIESAQFFLMVGLLAALAALRRASDRPSGLALFALAGTAWALAVGCRVSVLLAAAALVVITALAGAARAEWPWRSASRRAVALGAPLALVVLALGLYNYARFGSFFDFGTEYMLTKKQFAPQASFVLPNVHSYLLRRYTVSCEFPFLGAPFFANALTPAWVDLKSGWVPQEPVVGLLIAVPGVVFATIAVWTAASRFRRRHWVRDTDAGGGIYEWLVASCLAIWCLAAMPTLGVWTSTMRYLSDVTSSALLLAILGFWTALAALAARPSRVVARYVVAVAAVLALYSVVVGVALGFQGGYYRAIKASNPMLHAKLIRTFSLCGEK